MVGNINFQFDRNAGVLEEDALGRGPLIHLFYLGLITNEALALSYTSLLTFHDAPPEEDFIACGLKYRILYYI